MNQFISQMRLLPKRTSALVAMALTVVAVPAALLAWGPSDRPTFTMEKPADHVTFNSITNNPKHGDERNFVQIRNYTDNGTFGEQVNLQPGKEYEVYVYYHNNAAANLNDAAHNYEGIATGAFMRVEMPESIAAGGNARVTGYVGATNANPAQVWDEAYAKNDTTAGMALRYVPNSAVIHSNGAVNGQKLDLTKLASNSGHLLGYDSLNGKLPGCGQFAGYVTYRFVAAQPNFEITKQVSIAGKNDFKKEVTAAPGTEVQYKIQYKNTGSVQQDNVTIRDVLPKNVSYVAGSTYMASSKTNGVWSAVSENTITQQGLNIGSYAPNGNAYLVFKAKLPTKEQLATCGPNKLINVAHADTENGSKSDDATVVVEKECPPTPVTPIYTCDTLTVKKINRTTFEFVTAYTLKNATLKSTTYIVRDASGKEVYRGSNANYTQTTVGAYTVEAQLVVTVDGKDVTVPVGGCKASFEVTPTPEQPKDIIVCRLEDKKYPVTIKESDFDPKKHSKNPEDCKTAPTPEPEKINVCVIESKIITTIDKGDFDATKHTTDLSKCSTPPIAPEKPVTPETPSYLPQTGTNDGIISALGLGSLVTVSLAYIASRRNSLLG